MTCFMGNMTIEIVKNWNLYFWVRLRLSYCNSMYKAGVWKSNEDFRNKAKTYIANTKPKCPKNSGGCWGAQTFCF